MAPALAALSRYALAENDVAAIIGALALPDGARVLDAGCGAGVHSVAFAKGGFAVTGIDRSETLLGIAREKAPGIAFLNADVREFVRPNAFDLVCSLYASFGYYDDETNRCVLRNFRTSLRDGGALVLDVIGGHWDAEARGEVDGTTFAVRRSFANDRLAEVWSVGGATFETSQRIYSPAELESMLRDAGFARVTLCASFDMTVPATSDASRLIAFAFVAG